MGEDPGGTGARAATRRRPSIVRLALVFYGALFAVAWLWCAWAGRPLWYASAEAARRGAAPATDLAVGLGAGLLVVWASQEITRRTGWGEALARALAALLGHLDPSRCALLALASGLAEEAFFRGALQPRVGLVAASVLFALAHFVPRRDLLPWTGFSLAAGLLLGGLFEWTGNLLAPVVAHAVVNGVNLRFLSLRYAPGPPDLRPR